MSVAALHDHTNNLVEPSRRCRGRSSWRSSASLKRWSAGAMLSSTRTAHSCGKVCQGNKKHSIQQQRRLVEKVQESAGEEMQNRFPVHTEIQDVWSSKSAAGVANCLQNGQRDRRRKKE